MTELKNALLEGSALFPPTSGFLQRAEDRRNVCIMAHIDSGKTTLTERILYFTGRQHTCGDIKVSKTTTDWMPLEQERGITITAATVSTKFERLGRARPVAINIIDTPGHVDFTIEVERSNRVSNGGVTVAGIKGFEAQTDTVWMQANRWRVARLIFANKMDMQGADFDHVIESFRQNIKGRLAILQRPIGREADFRGVVDLLSFKANVWKSNDGFDFSVEDVPADMIEECTKAREALVELIVEESGNDDLVTRFLSGETLGVDELKAALRAATIDLRVFPILCGSAAKNKGVQPLLDAIVDYLPSPLDVPMTVGTSVEGNEQIPCPFSDTAPPVFFAFKAMTTQYGERTFVQVVSGVLKPGRYWNATQQQWVNIGRLAKLQGIDEEPQELLEAGDIGVIIGISEPKTGDTYCVDREHELVLESIQSPEPVVEMAIAPKHPGDMQKMMKGLKKICTDDPSLVLRTDPKTKEIIVGGMGELALQVMERLLLDNHKVEIIKSPPKVKYFEAIGAAVDGIGNFKKQSGGHGHMAFCKVTFEPQSHKEPFSFVDATIGGVIKKDYIPSIEAGIKKALEKGPLAGHPVIGIKATLFDGKYHDVDSSAADFIEAGRLALRDAFENPDAKPVLLEPIMLVTVDVPSDFVGGAIGELSARRGVINQQEASADKPGWMRITGNVPMATMFGFSDVLRSKTGGKGNYSMGLDFYKEVPASLKEEIIAAHQAAEAESKK